MPKKILTKTSKLLLWMIALGETAEFIFPSPREFRRRAYYGNLFETRSSFNKLTYYLVSKGYIKFVDKNNRRFIKLTKKGQMEALLAKALLPQPQKWDGRWRVIIFDI